MKPVLEKYCDKTGSVGYIKNLEDQPTYDGHYHKEWDEEMKIREKFKNETSKP